jgi:hypothetical protein
MPTAECEVVEKRLAVTGPKTRRRNAVISAGHLPDLAAALKAQHPDFATREVVVPQNGQRLVFLALVEFSLVANTLARMASCGQVTRQFILDSSIGFAVKRYITFAVDPCSKRCARELLAALKAASELEVKNQKRAAMAVPLSRAGLEDGPDAKRARASESSATAVNMQGVAIADAASASSAPVLQCPSSESSAPVLLVPGSLRKWCVADVRRFIVQLELEHVAVAFVTSGVDGAFLAELTAEDMVSELGLKPLQARKVFLPFRDKKRYLCILSTAP